MYVSCIFKANLLWLFNIINLFNYYRRHTCCPLDRKEEKLTKSVIIISGDTGKKMQRKFGERTHANC